jgi:quercetin dioxygenase-like cupin family protein
VELGQPTIVEQLGALELGEPGAAAAAIYDRPIALTELYRDPASGEEHYLIRYPAGTKGRAHTHTAAHTFIVLEGKLDANGTIVGPGAYAHFPAGEPMRHQATAEEPCLFVAIFHGPFDVEVVNEPT